VAWAVIGNFKSTTNISADGCLTIAPDDTASMLMIVANYKANNTINATALVTVTSGSTPAPTLSGVSVSPNPASVAKGGGLQMGATATMSNGTTVGYSSDVNWAVSGGGGGTSISAAGYLTVASGETAALLTVTATAKSNASVAGYAAVAVTSPATPPTPPTPTTPVVSGITLSPASSTVARGGSQSFTASATMSDGSVRGNVNSEVTFTVLAARNVGTTITDAGSLRVHSNEMAASLTVVATLRANPGVKGFAVVSLTGDLPDFDLIGTIGRTYVGGVVTIDGHRFRILTRQGNYSLLTAYDNSFGRSAFRADGGAASQGGNTQQANIDSYYRNMPSMRRIAVVPNLRAWRGVEPACPDSMSAPTDVSAGSQTANIMFALSEAEVDQMGLSYCTGAKTDSWWTRSWSEYDTSNKYPTVRSTWLAIFCYVPYQTVGPKISLNQLDTYEKLIISPSVWVRSGSGDGGNTIPVSYGSVAYRGGDGGAGGVTDASLPLGGAYVIKTQPASGVTRPGATFVSWNTRADGTGVTYTPGTTIYVTGNLELYAIWRVST
jgi:uncharacterized repeat protein (TIGR02543 family)